MLKESNKNQSIKTTLRLAIQVRRNVNFDYRHFLL